MQMLIYSSGTNDFLDVHIFLVFAKRRIEHFFTIFCRKFSRMIESNRV